MAQKAVVVTVLVDEIDGLGKLPHEDAIETHVAGMDRDSAPGFRTCHAMYDRTVATAGLAE
jgi:hypothetical protein